MEIEEARLLLSKRKMPDEVREMVTVGKKRKCEAVFLYGNVSDSQKMLWYYAVEALYELNVMMFELNNICAEYYAYEETPYELFLLRQMFDFFPVPSMISAISEYTTGCSFFDNRYESSDDFHAGIQMECFEKVVHFCEKKKVFRCLDHSKLEHLHPQGDDKRPEDACRACWTTCVCMHHVPPSVPIDYAEYVECKYKDDAPHPICATYGCHDNICDDCAKNNQCECPNDAEIIIDDSMHMNHVNLFCANCYDRQKKQCTNCRDYPLDGPE
jgi:hypothetical protein